MGKDSFLLNLKRHIPEEANVMVWSLIKEYNFTLTITNERITKNGDYLNSL